MGFRIAGVSSDRSSRERRPAGVRATRNRLIAWSANFSLVVLSLALTLTVLDAGFAFGRHLAGHDMMYAFDPVLGWRVLPDLDDARIQVTARSDFDACARVNLVSAAVTSSIVGSKEEEFRDGGE